MLLIIGFAVHPNLLRSRHIRKVDDFVARICPAFACLTYIGIAGHTFAHRSNRTVHDAIISYLTLFTVFGERLKERSIVLRCTSRKVKSRYHMLFRSSRMRHTRRAEPSTKKLDMLRSIGVDHVIDYTQEDPTQNARVMT
jgi:hypothetical protein